MNEEQAAKEFIDSEIYKLKKQKEKIEKSEKSKNKKAIELSDKLQELKKKNVSIENQILETRNELYKMCTHEKIKEENHTVLGGYLDQREYITEYWCEVCGIMVDRKVEYGGFE